MKSCVDIGDKIHCGHSHLRMEGAECYQRNETKWARAREVQILADKMWFCLLFLERMITPADVPTAEYWCELEKCAGIYSISACGIPKISTAQQIKQQN